MKKIKTKIGPVSERPYFEKGEIEDICLGELKKSGLLPDKPQPIRIDRFIENKFKITHEYERMNKGVLGFTQFGPTGVEKICVSRDLDEEGTKVSERRIRTTLAHEAGHALLHSFMSSVSTTSQTSDSQSGPKILCREIVGASDSKKYDGKWWEYQANRAMAALLLPKPLVQQVMREFLTAEENSKKKFLEEGKRPLAIQRISKIFDVNPTVARFYLAEAYPLTESE